MKQKTKQTTTTYKDLFPKTHEKVKSIVADESFGPRDVDELAERVVLEKDLRGVDVERIKKFAEERAFYLNDDEAEKVRETAKNHMDNYLNED